MDGMKKRARELLAKAYRQTDYPPMVHESHNLVHGRLDRREAAAIAAIIASLTPPEGWVLVPVVLTQEMEDAGYPADTAQEGWTAMLAARPKMP